MKGIPSGFLWGLIDRLAVRLLVLMSVALLPLGLIAVMTTANAIQDSEQAAEQALLGLTSQAVAGKRALIESAFAAASALGGVVLETRGNALECDSFMAQYVERSGLFSFVGFTGTDGEVQCHSHSAETSVSFADSPSFQAYIQDPIPLVTARAAGAVTGLPVVIVTEPVFTNSGLQGFISVSLTRRSLELLGLQRGRNRPRMVALLNSRGQIVSLGAETTETLTLPEGLSLEDMPARAGQVLLGSSHDGQPAVHAVVELLPGRLFAVGVWPASAPAVQVMQTQVLPLVLPVLMWVASLAVAFLAVYFLVVRPLRGLNRQMRRFALGQRSAWDDLPADASTEFREINATFRRMARIIARDEAEREDALAEKSVLLKEIHHRVKNNLQLIASIINLQIRELTDEASRAVLQNVQDRVLSMAAIHRALYEEQRLTDLRADRVLGEIVDRLVSLGTAPGHQIDVTSQFASVTLSAERMVPLSLLLTEVLTNAVQHVAGCAPEAPAWIEVSLSATPTGEAVLRVANARAPHRMANRRDRVSGGRIGAGLGLDLIEAFAAQIEAEVAQGFEETDRGPAHVTTLTFRLDPQAEMIMDRYVPQMAPATLRPAESA
jgi:two-component sensor histidine kinase